MNVNRLNLNLIKVFVAINECRNLTQAADRLYLSQPGVSHALKQLRDTFDDELFIRQNKEYHPTERAKNLAPAFVNALETLQIAIDESWKFDPATENATFRISTSDYASQSIVPRLIEKLAVLTPNVDCLVSQSSDDDVLSALKARSLDLAIISRLPETLQPGQQQLLSEAPCCIAHRDNPIIANGLDLKSFLKAEHVIVSSNGVLHSPVDKRLAELGKERHVRFSVPYFNSVAKIVASTHLIGTLPMHISEQAIKEYPLKLFPYPIKFPSIEFIMAWNPLREKDPQLLWLRNVITSIMPLRVSS